MSHRDTSSCHEEIVDRSGVQASIWDAYSFVAVNVDAVVASDPEAFGMVDVDTPIGEGYGILVHYSVVVFGLAHDVVTDEAAAFTDSTDVV